MLGAYWGCLRTSPDGYLVFKDGGFAGQKFLCYYLPTPPLLWAQRERRPTTKRVQFLHEQPLTKYTEEASHQDMDCSESITTEEMSVQLSGPCCFGDDLETDAEDASMSSGSRSVANWNDSFLVALVLDYLVGATKVTRKIGRRRVEADGASDDDVLHKLRLVSKDWAVGCYRLLARVQCNHKFGTAKNYEGWSSFVRKYCWGAFLSSGACKEVFSVQRSGGRQCDAVSVMDLDDLRRRDMDFAVTQELEVSMLCSSLLDLHICPNMLKIHSVFQSCYGPPEALWRNTSPDIDSPPCSLPVMVPKAAQQSRGRYQFIRMELCAGGDLEDYIRKTEFELSTDTIQSMLFQMFFALYACREKLCLRHFDLKLLNFFVTDCADIKAESSMANVPKVMSIGFGEQIFFIPLLPNEMKLIKLADFGTSMIGVGSIGDPIGANQVLNKNHV